MEEETSFHQKKRGAGLGRPAFLLRTLKFSTDSCLALRLGNGFGFALDKFLTRGSKHIT